MVEVERYSFISEELRQPLGKSPVNRSFLGGHLMLRGCGRQLRIAHYYQGLYRVLDRVFAELHSRLAKRAEFGELAFDGITLRHLNKDALSLAEVKKVVIRSHGSIVVHKHGKRLHWARCRMDRVDNVLMLLERLAQRSVALELSPVVFLPLSTFKLLGGVGTTSAVQLPQAKLRS